MDLDLQKYQKNLDLTQVSFLEEEGFHQLHYMRTDTSHNFSSFQTQCQALETSGTNRCIFIVGISTRKRVTVFCDRFCIRHHKGGFDEIIICHHQLFRGGNITFFALSSIVDSTLRWASESFGVGNLPLRSASSVKIRASSPHSSGDVLIVIAISNSVLNTKL